MTIMMPFFIPFFFFLEQAADFLAAHRLYLYSYKQFQCF